MFKVLKVFPLSNMVPTFTFKATLPSIIEKMKYRLFIILILFGISLICCGKGNRSRKTIKKRPNVVYINVDDLGWKDLGFMDKGYFETPNIDRFSKSGITFTNAYASAANCAPSRACLMTGQYAPRHGIYTVSPSARGSATSRKLIPIKNTDSLNSEVVTLADMFKMAGYTTGTFGKWHLGKDPLQQGFDVNVGGSLRGNPGKNGYFSPYKIDNIKNGPRGEHLTDRLTTEAIQFLRQNKDTPFFLYLPFYSVHTPIMAKENLIEISRDHPKLGFQILWKISKLISQHLRKTTGKLVDYMEK